MYGWLFEVIWRNGKFIEGKSGGAFSTVRLSYLCHRQSESGEARDIHFGAPMGEVYPITIKYNIAFAFH